MPKRGTGCSALASKTGPRAQLGPSTFDKKALEGYSVEKHYNDLCSTFPTAMTVAAALVTKEKSRELGLKVTT